MKHEYVVVNGSTFNLEEPSRGEAQLLLDLLAKGYVIEDRPLVAERDVHYRLVLYESEDEKPQPELKQREFQDIEGFKDVPNSDVETLLNEGYEIHAIYAKNTIMLKWRKPEGEKS